MRLASSVVAGVTLFILSGVAVQLGYFETFRHLDKLLHLIGGVVVGIFVWAVFEREISRLSRPAGFVFILGAMAIIGIFWEIAEYNMHLIKETAPLIYKYFHGGGLADTLADLVMDLLGAGVFAFWATRRKG